MFVLPLILGSVARVIKMFYAKNNGVKNWGLAILPIGTDYITGKLADMYSDKKAAKILPVLSATVLATGALDIAFEFIPISSGFEPSYKIINTVLAAFYLTNSIVLVISLAALLVLNIMAYYRIFAYKSSNNASVWTVLSILLIIPLWIFMLAFMKKQGNPKEDQEYTAENETNTAKV